MKVQARKIVNPVSRKMNDKKIFLPEDMGSLSGDTIFEEGGRSRRSNCLSEEYLERFRVGSGSTWP